MKPIGFRLANVTYGKDQTGYEKTPALKIADEQGHVITRWKLNWKERLRMLFKGEIWFIIKTYNHPLQYIQPQTNSPFNEKEDE